MKIKNILVGTLDHQLGKKIATELQETLQYDTSESNTLQMKEYQIKSSQLQVTETPTKSDFRHYSSYLIGSLAI